MGTMDEGTIIDEGPKMQCENKFYENSRIDENNDLILNLNGHELYEHQVGESIVFEYFNTIFGQPLDTDQELMDLEMQGYKCVKKNGWEWVSNLK